MNLKYVVLTALVICLLISALNVYSNIIPLNHRRLYATLLLLLAFANVVYAIYAIYKRKR